MHVCNNNEYLARMLFGGTAVSWKLSFSPGFLLFEAATQMPKFFQHAFQITFTCNCEYVTCNYWAFLKTTWPSQLCYNILVIYIRYRQDLIQHLPQIQPLRSMKLKVIN